jgi:hypothetical protein
MSIGRRVFFAAAASSLAAGAPAGGKTVADRPFKLEWVSQNGPTETCDNLHNRFFVDPVANRFGSVDIRHGDVIGLRLDEVVDLLVRSGVVRKA